MTILKPCPFCGYAPFETPQNTHHPLPDRSGYQVSIWCQGCDAEGGQRLTDVEAIKAWNRRVHEPVEVLEGMTA